MNENFLVIEDSSKTVFGGGQKISLLMMEILSKKGAITLFDTNDTSVFATQAKKSIKKRHILLKFGKVRSGAIGVLYKIGELLSLPFLVVINTAIIVKATRKMENKTLYAATKKSLIIAYISSIVLRCDFIYHSHLVEHGKVTRAVLKAILKNAKYVIAVSDVVKENINLPNVIRVYNPIVLNPAVMPKNLNDEKVVVGFFASLIKIKGLKYFLDSYEYLDKKLDVEYWIFGDGPDAVMFDSYKYDKIKAKGFTNNVLQEMAHVHILCFPSIIEESLGMVILEAFMSGVPVITTNIGGQAEVVIDGYNGLHVPIKNGRAIADKISYLINNKKEYSRLSENAISSSKKFDYNDFETQIQMLIN